MQEWITQTLESPSVSAAVLAAAFLLGLLGCVTSACNLAVLGAIAGYSGSMSGEKKRRHLLLAGLFFLLGTMIAMAVLGAVTGFVSQTIGATLGSYWKIFAGLLMVLLGLVTLGVFPFKLPKISAPSESIPTGAAKAIVYGLLIGGATTACSAGCSPVLPVVLGVVTLQGRTAWGAVVLAVFAVGYSLPIAAAFVGLSAGLDKFASATRRVSQGVKVLGGVLLAGVGFYLLLKA